MGNTLASLSETLIVLEKNNLNIALSILSQAEECYGAAILKEEDAAVCIYFLYHLHIHTLLNNIFIIII